MTEIAKCRCGGSGLSGMSLTTGIQAVVCSNCKARTPDFNDASAESWAAAIAAWNAMQGVTARGTVPSYLQLLDEGRAAQGKIADQANTIMGLEAEMDKAAYRQGRKSMRKELRKLMADVQFGSANPDWRAGYEDCMKTFLTKAKQVKP